jgi:hypothetical protein
MISSRKFTGGKTFFTCFFEEVTEKSLSDYFDRFLDLLEEKGIKTVISKKEIFENITSNFSRNSLPLKLSFSDKEDNWKIVVFNTRIPHIEGEITVNKENAALDEQFLFLLIRNNLASIVMHEPRSNDSKIGKILKIFDPTRNFLLTGNKMDIYFILKIDTISNLRKSWKQDKNSGKPSFYIDFLRFFKCCIIDDMGQISLSFNLKVLQNFIDRCDAEFSDCSKKEEFAKFLSRFSINSDDWSKAVI